MNPYIAELKRLLAENPPIFGDGDSILTMPYEVYSDIYTYNATAHIQYYLIIFETGNNLKNLRSMLQ